MNKTRAFRASQKNKISMRIVLAPLVLFIFASIAPFSQSYADGPLKNGGEVAGGIYNPEEIDVYTFEALIGQGIWISIYGQTKITLEVRAPSGALVTTDRQLTGRKLLHFAAPEDGTYKLIISGFYPGTTGTFDIHYAKAPGANEYGKLGDDATVRRTTPWGDIDSYTIDANIGETLVFLLNGIGTTLVNVYDPDGFLIPGLQWGLEHRATKAGTYTVIVVDPDLHHQQTPYELRFAKLPGASELGMLEQSGRVSDALSPVDFDTFTFRGKKGQSAQFSINESMGLKISGYAPDGRRVLLHYTTFGSTFIFTSLPEDGVYTVLLQPHLSRFRSGNYTLSYTAPKIKVSYAALGDSYSSGEGVFPMFQPYAPFTACNRSSLAYSTQVRVPYSALPLSLDPDATFDFYACTGAVTENITASGKGQHGEPPQATPAQVNSSRDLITIGIGGNDSFFAPLLGYCLVHNDCLGLKPFAPHNNTTLGDLLPLWLPVVGARLVKTYSELRDSAPNATIIALDYPLVLSGNECPLAKVPFSKDLKLSSKEQKALRESNEILNEIISLAAEVSGIHSVSVQDRFQGHGVCGVSDDWIFGSIHFWPKGLFHPNARGQLEYGRAINDYLKTVKSGWPHGYFATGLPRNPPPLDGPRDWPVDTSLPALGELTIKLNSATICNSLLPAVAPGASITVAGKGFSPNEPVKLSITVKNTTVSVGSFVADSRGELKVTTTVPSTIQSTAQASIQALGKGVNGNGLLLLATRKVSNSLTADIDRDGIPDACDNCPQTVNPQQKDRDSDDVGDLCDRCPDESIDDEDRDGICAPADICPHDILNDSDGDGICAPADNCPVFFNPDQKDVDGDGVGDLCESLACHELRVIARSPSYGRVIIPAGNCGDSGYMEGSQILAIAEPYPGYYFTGWSEPVKQDFQKELRMTVQKSMLLTANFCDSPVDEDGDRIADNCDNCPDIWNPDQKDSNNNKRGDACEKE